MSVQMVLLPVFVLVALTFALFFGMAGNRMRAMKTGQAKPNDIVAGTVKWPARAAQFGDCFRNQFEIPVLFYALIAIGLPLRRIDLVLVLLSWVFVVARLAHAGIFVTSNDLRPRAMAWFASALVLMAMWIYFALKMLLATVA
ncbi:MAG: hypothetical protein JWQ51_1448 [Tardiphaga sp.]|jgi:hypothetical protein|nr:hypothetical protein [Tardiphaga sp.]